MSVDTFKAPGEALELVGHFDTLEEAERARTEYLRDDPDARVYVYGRDTK